MTELAPVDADGVLQRVLLRMREQSDFPALSASVVRIQRVTNSESVNLANLSDEIMKDVALTNKLLRMVNSTHYAPLSAGTVTTVSRAAALVGFVGIRNMAMSLVWLDHMQDKVHAKQIQAEFVRTLMAGALADELSSGARDGEEALDDFEAASLGARGRVTEMAQAMNLTLDADSPARRLLLSAASPGADFPPLGVVPVGVGAGAAESSARAAAVVDVMASGVQEITNRLVDSYQLDDVLREILRVMQRAIDFRQVLICLRDARGEILAGKLGVGTSVQASVARFKVSLGSGTDLFSVVCNKGVDTLISDATLANIAQRLPAWYRSSINAPAFLLLPLQIKGKPFGLIYADKPQAGGIELTDKELALLRTLRNQAVMAFRQSR